MKAFAAAALATFLIFASVVRADDAKWDPICYMSGEIFPAYLIATASRPVTPEAQADAKAKRYLGDISSLLSARIKVPVSNAKVTLQIQCDSIISAAEITCTLDQAGKEYRVFPKIAYKYAELEKNRQAQPLPLIFKLSVNGGAPMTKILNVRLRSINDCPIRVPLDGQMQDFRWMLTAYVNEDHPWVDEILKRALGTGVVRQFDGYGSRNDDAVKRQILAVWTVFQRDGIKYSNIGIVSPTDARVADQHVRFFDEVIREKQANCVDGTLLFASVLRKIGLRPKLVALPDHMFLVVQLKDGDNSPVIPVETTAIGATDAAGQFITFPAAVKLGEEKYRQFQDMLKEKTGDFPKCQLLDVAEYRQKGISAIPYTRDPTAAIPRGKPNPVTQKFNVPQGNEGSWTFTPPNNVPGTLSGHWNTQGKSAALPGATDDTIIGFKLIGANNEVLASESGHPTSGNFRIHCEADGKYTFKFNNSGIIRSSSRNVIIDATFQPD